jgi:hypothetical protein
MGLLNLSTLKFGSNMIAQAGAKWIHLQRRTLGLVCRFRRGILYRLAGRNGGRPHDGQRNTCKDTCLMLEVDLIFYLQRSKETGKEVVWTDEENYKFRLSEFRLPLKEWVEKTSRKPASHTRRAC